MKKRLLSLVLCLVMVFSLLPTFGVSAAAADEEDYVYEEATPSNGSTWTNSDNYTDRTLYYHDTATDKYWPVSTREGTVFYPESYSVKAGGSFTGNTYYYYDSSSDDYYPVKAGYGALFSPFDSYLKIYGNFSEDDDWQTTGHYGRVGFNESDDRYIYYYGSDGEMHMVYYNVKGHGGGLKNGYYGITLWVYTDITNEPPVKEKTTGLFNSHDYYYIDEINSSNKFSTALSNGTITRIKNGTEGYGSDEYYYWQYLGATTHAGTETAYYRDTLYYYTSDGLYELYYTDGNNQFHSIKYMPIKDNYIVQNETFYRATTGANSLGYTDGSGWHELGSTKLQTNGTVYGGKLYTKEKDEAPEPTPPGVDIDNEDINILNPDGASNESFKLQKALTPNDQGSYDITMQSYSTAATKTINLTEKVPTDFIVVVDQSGSMDYRDMPTGDPTPAGTKTLEDVAQEGTAEKDKTGYYVKDGDNYYRVYAKSDYLMEYHETESKWTKNIIEEAGYDLSWFQGKDEASFGLDNQYYYKTKDGIYRPVHVTATGKIGTYYIEFYYIDANGKQVDFVRPSKPVYKNVFGSVFGKYGPGSLGYSAVNAAVLTAYPRTTAYTYSTFLGVTTGMYVNYPMYTRHVGYTQLCYRDVNGVEHIVKSTSGLSTAEYCDANGNAVVAEDSNDRMEYTNLYTYGTRMKRIDALKAALNDFVKAVANETDARDPDHPGEKTAVDNRIAIVGFSSDDNLTHGWGYRYYDNTEILTTGLSGTDGVQMREAGSEDYAAALVAATDGVSYGEDHVNPTLTNAINAITANGGTQPEYGFDMAQNILLKRNSDGRNTHTMTSGEVKNRNTIVIFFTDGRPGDYDDSDQYSEANQVIDAAKDVKALGAKVFSIGVFGESDGNPLTYDASNDKTKDVNGREVSVKNLNQRYWKYLGGYVGISQDGSCLRRQWRPNNAVGYTPIANDTIYDYMSVASSNYPNAKKYIADEWLAGTYGGTYTEATEGVNVRDKSTASAANQFYRMASDQKTLVSAFEQSITYASSLQVDTGVVSLDSNAVFRDVVNVADFDVSNATYTVEWQPIKVDKSQVSPAHPSAIFPDDTRPTRVMVDGQPVPADGVVEYSGFDYGANYVSLSKKTGYKLVVTIHGIVPRDSMYDNAPHKSNADPSNTVYACGIYQPGSTTPELQVESPTLRLKKPLPQEPASTAVEMTKSLSSQDGYYTITLDAYAKGNSKQQSQSTAATDTDVVISLDADAYLLDVIELQNLAVRDDLSEPIVKVYTQKGTYNLASSNPDKIDWDSDSNREDITSKVDVIYDGETGAVKVTGFDYSANFIADGKLANPQEGTAANQGKKIIVEISGLVPTHPGEHLAANVQAGVFDKDDDQAASAPNQYFDVAGTNNSMTYVIDFSAPMIIATEAQSVVKMQGKNGEFSLVKPNETATTANVVYQLNKSVNGSSLVLEGVDKAFALAKPVGLQTRDWCVLTTIPAGSVYFDDDLTATTTMQPKVDEQGQPVLDDEGNPVYEPRTDFKDPINVGNGSGYNAQITATPATENEPAGRQTFTFYGTGIDVYCTTDSESGYVQAMIDNNHDTIQSILNHTDKTARYNVPTISFRDLTPGVQHTLTLNVLNSSKYKLDGIRVYNPVSNETYEGQGTHEQYATFINLRDALVNDAEGDTKYQDSTGNVTIDENQSAVLGALFVDDSSKLKTEKPSMKWDPAANEGAGAWVPDYNEDGTPKMAKEYASQFEAYKEHSPKHEIYLAAPQAAIPASEGVEAQEAKAGEAIIFRLTSAAVTAAANGNLWIGLSAPDAGNNSGTVKISTVEKQVTSGVDMYYPITSDMIGTDNVVTITNIGSSMISVTNLKITGNEDIYNAANTPAAGTESVSEDAVILSVEDVIPMVFEPVTMQTVKIAANDGVDPDAEPTTEPSPEPTPDPTVEPTEQPAQNWLSQLISNFVSMLFRSISRLFGN